MSYFYIKSEPNLWTVGFEDSKGQWHTDSDHDTKESAANRTILLNGGKPPAPVSKEIEHGRKMEDKAIESIVNNGLGGKLEVKDLLRNVLFNFEGKDARNYSPMQIACIKEVRAFYNKLV